MTISLYIYFIAIFLTVRSSGYAPRNRHIFRLGSVRRGVLTEYKYYKPSKYSKVGFPDNPLPEEDKSHKFDESKVILSKTDPSYLKQLQENKYFLTESFKAGVINCPSFSSDYIQVAKINKVHGLKGHLKALSFGYIKDEEILRSKYLFLQFDPDHEFPLELEYAKLSNKSSYFLKFKGIDNSIDAARLIGAFISIPTSNLSMPDDNVYFIQDLIGMDLYLYSDPTKTKLGNIVDCVSRHDIAPSKSLEAITDDLLEVDLDIKLSLTQLKTLLTTYKNMDLQLDTENNDSPVTLLDKEELEDADNVSETIEGTAAYVKLYKCSDCDKSFTKADDANSHTCGEASGSDILNNELYSDAIQVVSLEDMIDNTTEKKRAFIPLDKDRTVRHIDVPRNSAYIDTFTVFLAEHK